MLQRLLRNSILLKYGYLFRYYLKIFILTFREQGGKEALKKVIKKTLPKIGEYKESERKFLKENYLPFFDQAIPKKLNLIIIITDTQIDQCLTYRINQKIVFFEKLGYSVIKFSSSQIGKIKSFSKIAKVAIIYRTSMSEVMVEHLKINFVKVYFEFDDLVVGRELLDYSGIKASLNTSQTINIEKESVELENTALLCDEIIVSTNELHDIYKKNSHSLKGKKINVINNYLVRENFSEAGVKKYDFAFTTPSLSIGPELELINVFFQRLNSNLLKGINNKRVLVVGNKAAHEFLSKKGLDRIEFIYTGYLEYEEYIKILKNVAYVLVPLTDLNFNKSKTAIRAYDSLLAGAIPLVSPVGEYSNFMSSSGLDSLVVKGNDWLAAADKIDSYEENYLSILSLAQEKIKKVYGWDSAKTEYLRFLYENS